MIFLDHIIKKIRMKQTDTVSNPDKNITRKQSQKTVSKQNKKEAIDW